MYGLITYCRNKLYDWGVFRSYEVAVPTIGVGNVAVGGTGKTPHTMALIEHLASHNKVAVLSRGYKRKTTGFVLADVQSTAETIGDEPMLIHTIFPRTIVAVCEDRVEGVRALLRLHPDLDVVILDDAFQHRRIRLSYPMVLTAYDRLYVHDCMLPLGRLRDNKSSVARAHGVVVTKCPDALNPVDMARVRKQLHLAPYQSLHFTRMVYEDLQMVFPLGSDTEQSRLSMEEVHEQHKSVLMLTGIAQPQYMQDYLAQYAEQIVPCVFPDHHHFTRADMQRVEQMYDKMAQGAIVVTTEKDAMRLIHHPHFPEKLKARTYALPMRVEFLADEAGYYERISKTVSSRMPREPFNNM